MSEELREQARKVIRDYYNKTFEYAIEQLSKGDISAAIANAEDKQKALDDPYLDQLEALFTQELNKFAEEITRDVIGEDVTREWDEVYAFCNRCSFEPTDDTDHCICWYNNRLKETQRTALTAKLDEWRER